MPLPASLHAYTSEMEAFDRAKSAPSGIRIEFPDRIRAMAYRARLHGARVLDRKENSRVVDKTSPLYGKSDYDCIVVSIKEDTDGKWWLYLEKNEVIPGIVEEL